MNFDKPQISETARQMPAQNEKITEASFEELLNMYFTKEEQTKYINEDASFILQELYTKDQDIINNAKENEVNPTLTLNHSLRVTKILLDIENKLHLKDKLQLSDDQFKEVVIGSLVHDLGKKFIPTETLNKVEKLSPEEESSLKMHSRPLLFFKKEQELSHEDEKILNFLETNPVIVFLIAHHHATKNVRKLRHPQSEYIDARQVIIPDEEKYKKAAIIISLADMIDSLTSKFRSYIKAQKTKDEISDIMTEEIKKIKHYHPEILNLPKNDENDDIYDSTIKFLLKNYDQYI